MSVPGPTDGTERACTGLAYHTRILRLNLRFSLGFKVWCLGLRGLGVQGFVSVLRGERGWGLGVLYTRHKLIAACVAAGDRGGGTGRVF